MSLSLPPPVVESGMSFHPVNAYELLKEVHVSVLAQRPFTVVDSLEGPGKFEFQLNLGGANGAPILQLVAASSLSQLNFYAEDVGGQQASWICPDSLNLDRPIFSIKPGAPSSTELDRLEAHAQWKPSGKVVMALELWNSLDLRGYWAVEGPATSQDTFGWGLFGHGNGANAEFTNAQFTGYIRYRGFTSTTIAGGGAATNETSNLSYGVEERTSWMGDGEKIKWLAASSDLTGAPAQPGPAMPQPAAQAVAMEPLVL